MAISILNIGLIVLLLIISIQDIKYRAIHFMLPIAVFIFSIIKSMTLNISIYESIRSFSFLIVIAIGLFLYFSIKSKKLFNPINKVIGIGDVVFFVAVIPLFSSKSYILFIISGMLFSILAHLIVKFIKGQDTIPLAGFLSIYMILIVFMNNFVSEDLFTLYF